MFSQVFETIFRTGKFLAEKNYDVKNIFENLLKNKEKMISNHPNVNNYYNNS